MVAIKNITLFIPPSGKIPQIKVAINAKCNSVSIPAKLIRSLSKPMAKIAPKLRAPSPVTKRNISTDKSVAQDYFKDPLVFRSLTFRFGYAITQAQTFVDENIDKLTIPTIVLHGKGDSKVPISGCKNISKLEYVNFIEV